MNDDYLWDRSGRSDPQIQHLENVLSQFQGGKKLPDLPQRSSRKSDHSRFSLWTTLAAATAAAAIIVFAFSGNQSVPMEQAKPSWKVAVLQGTPRYGSLPISGSGHLAVGDWLETDPTSLVRLIMPKIGQVEVNPQTRIRIKVASEKEYRLELASGKIHATVLAPPRLFLVETPSALAVDLGCSYNLEVNQQGDGFLQVATGWVAFEREGHESVVPAGAQCKTKKGIGLGTPYFPDATEKFTAALARFDFGTNKAHALDTVLAESRTRDGLTLWHLLSRVEGADRARVFNQLVLYSPLPSGVTKEGVLRLDPKMLKQWFEGLKDPQG